MDKLPVTVIVPTINAAGHLDELLEGIQPHVADVFLVDSLSIDQTIDIALRRGVKIVQRPFATTSDQFGWMLHELPIKTPWIFFMAQDERFTDSLVRDLARVLSTDDGSYDGYTVRWRLWFMGKPLHAATDNLRLLRTGKCDVTRASRRDRLALRQSSWGTRSSGFPTPWPDDGVDHGRRLSHPTPPGHRRNRGSPHLPLPHLFRSVRPRSGISLPGIYCRYLETWRAQAARHRGAPQLPGDPYPAQPWRFARGCCGTTTWRNLA